MWTLCRETSFMGASVAEAFELGRSGSPRSHCTRELWLRIASAQFLPRAAVV